MPPDTDWLALYTGKSKLLGTKLAIEEGCWDDDFNFGAPYRVMCDTHGDNRTCVTEAEAERLVRHPWTWCHGCQVMFEEQQQQQDPTTTGDTE